MQVVSQSRKPSFQTAKYVYKEKCNGCGRCRGITEKSTVFICFNDAKKLCGKYYTLEELFKEIEKDKIFFETSGGGVTFSGGECMLQIDYLKEILKKCKENNINTAVDTAGYISWEHFEKIIPYTDLFLYDIKAFDNNIHKNFTGVSNELILANLKKLLQNNCNVQIRVPIISNVNDNINEMQKIKEFISPFENTKIELLPYHKMGEHKYNVLNMNLTEFTVPTADKMKELNKIFK